MNTLLEKLFDEYNLSEKTSFEIKQIFQIVTDEKKNKILNNFKILVKKIEKIEQENLLEQEILLDNILPDLKELLK
jgi:predicted Zn-ribbon and HTH transcriptional regulator